MEVSDDDGLTSYGSSQQQEDDGFKKPSKRHLVFLGIIVYAFIASFIVGGIYLLNLFVQWLRN